MVWFRTAGIKGAALINVDDESSNDTSNMKYH